MTRDLAGPFLTDADRRQVLAEADFPEEMVDALLRDLDIVANPFHPSFFQTLNFVVSPLTFLGETIKFGAGIVVGGGLELASGRLPSIGETQERFEELPLAAQIASEFVLTAPFFSVKLATGITRFGTTTAKFGAKQLVAPSRRIGTLARPVVVSEQGSFRIAGRAPHVPPSPVTDALIELPELGKLADAVTTSENRLVRTLFGQTGLVPSILRTTPVGRIMVGNARMAIVSENILQAEIAARLVTHLQGVRGGARALMKIDEDGFVEGTGKLWQDVFGNPGAYKLNEGQRAFIRDFNVYIKGLEDMKVTAGLRKEGLFDVGGIIYVPRKAVAIEIIDKTGKKVTTKRFELPSQSNSKLRRVHDSATEGHGRGTIYHNDPLATAELHGRQTLREISNKKLSEALAPHGITGKELLPKAIVSEATAAAVAVSKQLIDIRAVTRQIATSERALLAAKKVLGERKRFEGILSEQRRAMSKFVRPKKGRRLPPRETLEPGLLLSAQARLDASLRHLDDLRLLRGSLQDDLGGMTKRLDRGKRALKDERDVLASRRQKAPGRLFGRSDEFITVKMWNGGPGANRFYPLDEIKFLEEGIRSVSGGRVVEGFTRAANALRTGVAVFDFALAGIQGLPVLVTNPKAWSQMFMKNVQGTYDPSTFARMTAHFRDEV
ncbi:MAG: hypothetical protein IIC73_02605, partial [Armatimonadetes bacterium]|nr:hypothetical protein [Armatimonadota bacterium]